jgi:hypothetical protein
MQAYMKTTMAFLLRWAKDDNLWKRRTAILSQRRFKEATDLRAVRMPALRVGFDATVGGARPRMAQEESWER